MSSNRFVAKLSAVIHWVRNDLLQEDSFYPRLMRAYILPASACLLLGIALDLAIDATWFQWWLVLSVVLGVWFVCKCVPALKNISSKERTNKTHFKWFPRPVLKRQLVQGADGKLLLEVRTEIRRREGLRVKVTPSQASISVIDNGFVDSELLQRSSFIPIAGEKEIYHFRRLDWFSHGPRQLLVLILGLPTTYAAFAYAGNAPGFTVALTAAFVYWWIWMRWAYTYFVLTDARVQRIFKPPLHLPGTVESSLLSRLVGARSDDPHWYTNLFGYGTVYSETAASEVDKWIKDGVQYVRQHHEVRDMMEMLQLHLNSSANRE